MRKKKKVTFKEEEKIIIYYQSIPDDSGFNWLQEARDRIRFERRISLINKNIGWIFKPDHRHRILNDRVV
jgi:hypothetical protein